jgi:flagellar hook protein FlgE
MSSAISIGTTGMTASSKQMDVIGNNLANANTLGFKSGSTYFASMLNQSLSSSGNLSTGSGVAVSDVQTQFSQGSFETTGNATDLAIDGDGFFMVKDANDAMYFTRAGAFHISEDGLLVDGNNYKVQGYNTYKTVQTASTDVSDEEADISLKNVQSAPKASTEISLGANLDENALYGEKFNVSQTVFDSKGRMHNLSITFLKTEGNGMWGFDIKLDETNLSDSSEQAATGLIFDKDGGLTGMYKGDIANTAFAATGGGTINNAETIVARPGQLFEDSAAGGITLTKQSTAGVWKVTTPGGYDNAVAWQETSNGKEILKVDMDGKGGSDVVFTLNGAWAANDTVTFDVTKLDVNLQDITMSFSDLGTGATIGETEGSGATIKNKINWNVTGDGAQSITGFASTSVIKALSDNGYTSGVLKSLSVDKNGIIDGFFTNGQTSQLGQLILADFPNPSGLKKIGNYFGCTTESGEAIKNKPGAGGLGEIMSNSLEISNVDVAKEFINMITAQRAYQASSRVITTADQMLTELMNIKR